MVVSGVVRWEAQEVGTCPVLLKCYAVYNATQAAYFERR